MRLAGKLAVVTGGNSGIGLAIARAFLAEGAQGAVHGRNTATLEAAAQALGPDFLALQGDVTRQADLATLFATVHEAKGKLDVLVVNAGGGIGPGTVAPLAEVSEASFDAMTDLNFKSAFFTVQHALPYMNDGASVIFIASIAAHIGAPGMAVYCASKAAVRQLARNVSMELLDRRIRANVISPGTIDTPVFGRLGLPEAAIPGAIQHFVGLTPLGRQGRPEEIAQAAVFLAADESAFVVGEEIIVDGGLVNL